MSSKAEQCIAKAEMLLRYKKHNDFDKVIESLENAIQLAKEDEDEFASLIQAHCFLGEVLFMKGDYTLASEHFSFIDDNTEKIYRDWDDVLNRELQTSDTLSALIKRYGLLQ